MTTQEIRNREEIEGNRVFLYREGLFWKAYEQSAYRCVHGIHPFKVTKRFVKSVGCEVLSIGFPVASLSKWAHCFEVESESEDGKQCVLVMKNLNATVSFEEWKGSFSLSEAKSKTEESRESMGKDAALALQILEELRRFDLAVKTPMDCMLWVAQMKERMNHGHV